MDEEVPELASLSNRFSYFENFKEDDLKKKSKKDEETGENEAARRECKARSVLNKFKEMETRALNGEEEGRVKNLYFLAKIFLFMLCLNIALVSLILALI